MTKLMALPTTTGPGASELPSRNDGVTIACPVCGTPFAPVGRRRYCSAACRQASFRRRQAPPAQPLPVPPGPPARPAREATIYECPTCGARFLGEQRCPDCHVFCRRIGPGGACPHCDEPVALADLIPSRPVPLPRKGVSATASTT
jgi:hypothetical protein